MLAELDELAQALARRVQRPVAIDDPSMRLLVHTPHHGALDTTRMQSILHLRADADVVAWALRWVEDVNEDLARLPAQSEWDLFSRVCVPLRSDGRTLGYMWLIDEDESLTHDQLADIAEAGRAAARIMAKGGMPRDTALVWERSLTQDLFLENPSIRAVAARSLTSLCGIDGRVQCVVFDLTAPVSEEESIYRALRRATSSYAHLRCLTLVESDTATLVVPCADGTSEAVDRMARVVRRELRGAARRGHIRSGVGGVCPGLEAANISRREALAALRVAASTGEFGDHARWSEIGPYRLLVHHRAPSALSDLLPGRLPEIMSDPAATDILSTVEVYLDLAGDVQKSIAALKIHRTSLYYRLRRFTEVSGMDLRDGQVRLTVHAALKLARLSGWRPGHPLPDFPGDVAGF